MLELDPQFLRIFVEAESFFANFAPHFSDKDVRDRTSLQIRKSADKISPGDRCFGPLASPTHVMDDQGNGLPRQQSNEQTKAVRKTK